MNKDCAFYHTIPYQWNSQNYIVLQAKYLEENYTEDSDLCPLISR